MDLPWGDEKTVSFITNVGLITTKGPNNDDIMACEWTHMISYSPGLVAVCIREGKATYENIKETKEFGVSLAATSQSVLANIAGGYSGHTYDKIAAAKELGFSFKKAREISVQMPEDSALALECKLKEIIRPGTHTIFIGEVVHAEKTTDKEPLAYHKGQYWKMSENLPKPSDEQRHEINQTVEKHKKV